MLVISLLSRILVCQILLNCDYSNMLQTENTNANNCVYFFRCVNNQFKYCHESQIYGSEVAQLGFCVPLAHSPPCMCGFLPTTLTPDVARCKSCVAATLKQKSGKYTNTEICISFWSYLYTVYVCLTLYISIAVELCAHVQARFPQID